ncbi:inactive protein RESTRICTED TEV MOVEMENT 1-like [Rhododendron vialii]|uniref:inactive protein RESTRICTED TEV MOVEMENT 1-like n=1 Tax=Rhododendron vialii TaxID=182163 RepID=UPI00265F1570|nr:inactive protein RESTRICTED TEV MOVEMENT 1-like [Rhododendron vialii]
MGTLGNPHWGVTWDDRGRTGIAGIFISHGDKIHSLQFQFVENGWNLGPVELNYPSESIIGISGYCSSREELRSVTLKGKGYCSTLCGLQLVTSINFITNNATYGPFGCPALDDTVFDFQIGGHNKFCGFHGNFALYLHSIGVYMEPMMALSNVNNLEEKVNIKTEKA